MARSISRQLYPWLCLLAVVIPNLTTAQQTASSGQWGPWTSWSICSKTCGSGLAYRIRHCHRLPGNSAQCSGPHKQYQLCNRQECPGGGGEDYRTIECRKQNRNSYGGRRYQWEAFINPYERCELACKARHHRYYARFQQTVQDGTKCKLDADAVCLSGECLEVGCDGILGSGAIVDQCGICGGDGSTCRVISGIFTRTRLTQYGYHHVATIPAGACNINITELAQSRNFLALTSAAGINILNGNKRLSHVGQYEGAGTTFDYRRRSGLSCPGACIFADGPIAQPVDIKLLYYDRNPGIMYHFTVPQDTADAVMNAAKPSTHNNYHQTSTSHHHRQQHTPHKTHNPPTDPNRVAETKSDNKNQEAEQSDLKSRTRNSRPERHKRPGHDKATAPLTLAAEDASSAPDDAADAAKAASLKDAPTSYHADTSKQQRRRNQHNRQLRRQERQRRRHQQRQPQPPSASGPETAPRSIHKRPRPDAVAQPRQASAPRFVPPEVPGEVRGGEGEEGAPIEYRHYYHVDSDDYRRLSRNNGYQAYDGGVVPRLSRNDVGGAGSETLQRPNIIPATRHTAQRHWGSSGSSSVPAARGNDVNDVGDVPLSVPASGFFVWTISGFSACSEPCGGGIQQTVVVCMKSDTRVEVMAENCNIDARPSPTTVECNTQPCDAKWTREEWSSCSVTCGNGVQTRRVECKQRISPTLQISVSADRCSNAKPPVTQFCRRQPCFQWRLSNWTKCSTTCGLGERTRTTTCISGEGLEVPVARCAVARPKTREICDMGSCAKGWYYTRWSKQCSPQCGSGKTHKERKVYCAAEGGGTLPGDKCPADQKPRTRKSCGMAKPCGGKWFSGPWSQCNATCGSAWRTREVICMKKHSRRLWSVVGKENCLRKERPPGKEICSELPPCSPEWYMTHWSKCSKSCGTGSKVREVKCLDPSLLSSMSCNTKRKPKERRPCNKHSCHNRNESRNQNRHANEYDTGPRRPHELYRESTSPNTTFQRFHRNRTRTSPRAPAALSLPSAADADLQQDFRSAMGDASEERHNRHHKPGGRSHQRQRHHHHRKHAAANDNKNGGGRRSSMNQEDTEHDKTTTVTTTDSTVVKNDDKDCKDIPGSRWCMMVSQARLCRYQHYRERCCRTCSKPDRHH